MSASGVATGATTGVTTEEMLRNFGVLQSRIRRCLTQPRGGAHSASSVRCTLLDRSQEPNRVQVLSPVPPSEMGLVVAHPSIDASMLQTMSVLRELSTRLPPFDAFPSGADFHHSGSREEVDTMLLGLQQHAQPLLDFLKRVEARGYVMTNPGTEFSNGSPTSVVQMPGDDFLESLSRLTETQTPTGGGHFFSEEGAEGFVFGAPRDLPGTDD